MLTIGEIMNERDWRMLTDIYTPREWDWLGDIADYMLFPFSEGDYIQWRNLDSHKHLVDGKVE